jgi:two-component system KDP operon response regulator KdpE
VTVVLVADQDRRYRRLAAAALRHGGYGVETAKTAKETVGLLRRRMVDAIVVDPTDPGATDVVQDLRLRTEIPIIVMAESAAEGDKVAALDAGADDYLMKPFGVEELLARLRAALRRTVLRSDEPPIATPDFVLYPGGRRLVKSDGSDVRLTPTEWRLLEVLARRPGQVVSQQQVLEEVWGNKAKGKPEYLRVHMVAIRRKVEPDPAEPRYLLTFPGLGLLFRPEGGTA